MRPIDVAAAPAPAAVLRKHRAIALGWWHGTSDNLRSSIILLIALVAFTAMVILIKVAGKRIPLVEILTVRQLVMQVLVASVVRVGFRQALRTRYPMLQIFRGVLQLGAMALSFAAVIHLPLAHAMVISFSYAIFVTIGAAFFLDEKVDRGRWIATVVGLAGVAIMLRPAGDASLVYSIVAVLGAVFAAGSAISLRVRLGTRADTVLTYQALVLLTAFAVPTVLVWVTPSFTELIVLLLVGVSGTVGQWMLTVAYQKGEAAALAPLDFVRLLLTTLCGFVFFGEAPDGPVIVGGIVLVGATAYTFRANARRPRKDLPASSSPTQ